MSSVEYEELDAGFKLKLEGLDDGGTAVALIHPDGVEEHLIGGFEYESPEDMIWCRDLGSLFYAGWNAGIEAGKAMNNE